VDHEGEGGTDLLFTWEVGGGGPVSRPDQSPVKCPLRGGDPPTCLLLLRSGGGVELAAISKNIDMDRGVQHKNNALEAVSCVPIFLGVLL